jgi:hypothetical protein
MKLKLSQAVSSVQLKTSESYTTIIKALAKKCMEFKAYKLKEERSYRAVLKICTIPPNLKKSEMKLRN